MTDLHGRTILIAGATGHSGRTAARTLAAAGARVVATGRDRHRLEEFAGSLGAGAVAGADASAGAGAVAGAVRVAACDLTDPAAVQHLADGLHADGVHPDGLLHLVGGWRGGGGLAGQTDEDYRFLEATLTALRHVTRAFDADLAASPAGRLAIVSSTAVARPLAGGANYAAVKAACEAWTLAVGQGWAKRARDAGARPAAASIVFRVKALAGLEQTLADRFAALWDEDAAALNQTIVTLEG